VRNALRSSKTVVIKVDVQGASSIREMVPEGIFIFLLPPSMAELMRRLRGRKTDDPGALMSRITTASQELRAARIFDYVVFNENERLEETLATIDAIMTAENCRVSQRHVSI